MAKKSKKKITKKVKQPRPIRVRNMVIDFHWPDGVSMVSKIMKPDNGQSVLTVMPLTVLQDIKNHIEEIIACKQKEQGKKKDE